MTDVFISYSRKDTEFVQHIFRALQAQEREAWVDWQGINYSTRWWEEICTGIENADNFVLVISPDSLNSVNCHRELEHACKFKKRLIPIAYRPVNEVETIGHWYTDSELRPIEALARQNWELLKSIQWIDYPRLGSFEKSLEQLIQTIDTDPERVRLHTRLLLRVRDWEGRGRSPSALLRGDELTAYEDWLKQSAAIKTEPRPTDEQQAYIAESRHYENVARENEQARITEDDKRIAALQTATTQAKRTRRQLLLTSIVAVILIVLALAAALLGFQGQRTAIERADQANTAVMVAAQALTPIPATLTNVAHRIDAGEATLGVVSRQLTEIPPTTTQLAVQLGAVATELAKNGVFICPGVVRPVFTQIKPGNYGQVTNDNGARRLNIREEPSISAKIIDVIEPGEIILILDGPVCDNVRESPVAWWNVRHGDVTGWSAESLDTSDRYIVPLEQTPTPQ